MIGILIGILAVIAGLLLHVLFPPFPLQGVYSGGLILGGILAIASSFR